MISRKIEKRLQQFYSRDEKKALLLTGARQVGKTFIVREFGKRFSSFVEINFLENKAARNLFETGKNSVDLLMRLSLMTDKKLIPGDTLIFLDEVQECKEIVTAIKFLVEEGSYRYVLSGSLLGVDLKDIRSVPVGYMDVEEMFPVDFEEFVMANGVSERVISDLREHFLNRTAVDSFVHEKISELFRLYLIVGGMPAVVNKYLTTNNIQEVIREQRSILRAYKKDIGKYDPQNKLYLEDIFDLIPSELNSKNKRFIMKDLNENFKLSRYTNSFIWLKDAGVAHPVYCVGEPVVPLLLSKATNLFKLFLLDVGLLASMYMDGIQMKILSGEKSINFGAVFENAVAQELKAHGFELYYYNNKKQGELDFVIERAGEVLPIEVKSGKDYTKHISLENVLANKRYGLKEAYVFYNGNVEVREKVVYYPVYMMMFLQKEPVSEDMVYRIDLEGLQ